MEALNPFYRSAVNGERIFRIFRDEPIGDVVLENDGQGNGDGDYEIQRHFQREHQLAFLFQFFHHLRLT